MVKDSPIIMSTLMVQAILEGRKTQTRRIIKPQPIDNTEVDGNFFEGNYKGYVKVDGHPYWRQQFADEFCRYSKSDLLWVREAFEIYVCNDGGDDYTQFKLVADGCFFKYNTNMRPGKHPSLHLPKDAARLFLEITNIRVERLQDISEEDAKAEGVKPFQKDLEGDCWTDGKYKTAYEYLWNEINGWMPNSWNENPFVWVIEFKKINN